MPHTVLTLKQAALHIRMPERELLHVAQRGEIPSIKRGDEYFFEHRLLDEWAQRRILGLSGKTLTPDHHAATVDRIQHGDSDLLIKQLLSPERIEPYLTSKTKPAVLRDMVCVAERTQFVFDSEVLLRAIEAREEVGSTAVGGGVAFLHAHFHDPYLVEESFMVLGRTQRPIFFGAQDGESTDLFFLVCCTDHMLHLHTLARLCLLVHGTDVLEALRVAEDTESMYGILTEAENTFVQGLS